MAYHWYVLSIKPHKERPVHKLLLSREVEVYFPALRIEPVNPRASKVRPYFPGYMFVKLDLSQDGNNVLRWTPGTKGLVRFGGEPAVVPDNLIHELRKRLAALEATSEEPKTILKQGDKVRITSGPFEGYEAIFDSELSGRDRVQVLLNYLNTHAQRVKLDRDILEKLN
jgi:transcriptional antiterminator RfaH